MTLYKCKQCGKTWFHLVWPNIYPTCKTSYWDIRPKKKEVSGKWKPWGDCLAAAPVMGESHNSNGSDRNYRFDYQAGVRDTFAQQGTAGLWNAEEGADGRRRRTLDKGVDQ